jgi:hypothetical protein
MKGRSLVFAFAAMLMFDACGSDDSDAAKLGERCGGLPAIQCDKPLYCHYEPQDICGATDKTGICKELTEACIAVVEPVCGCDGTTYGNSCEANREGVSVRAENPCDQPLTD